MSEERGRGLPEYPVAFRNCSCSRSEGGLEDISSCLCVPLAICGVWIKFKKDYLLGTAVKTSDTI